MANRPLVVMGTRPEVIKLAPVVRALRAAADRKAADRGSLDPPLVCFTGQHDVLAEPMLDYFDVQPDVRLAGMQQAQGLAERTATCLCELDRLVDRARPACLVAQGDTTTVLAAAMAAFYRAVPFVHVEAGLRTGNLAAPWPEEWNRRVAGITAGLHCCPTRRAADALLREGVPAASIAVTGNTVVDALLCTFERERRADPTHRAKYPMIDGRPLVLITMHRREHLAGPLEGLCQGIAELARRFTEAAFVYPVHLNPAVEATARRVLGGLANVHLTRPAAYPEFVWLMSQAALIVTDSGGIQEEAPTLGVPVLVTREMTERPEAIEAGVAELVGVSPAALVAAASRILGEAGNVGTIPREGIPRANPFGDGHAADRIVAAMTTLLGGCAAQ